MAIIRTAGDFIAKFLEMRGVEVVFESCGLACPAVLDGLTGTRIRYVRAHSHACATHAADGYFRVTHKPGVVLLRVGPGSANRVATGVATAALDCSAMVVIAGHIPDSMRSKDSDGVFQLHADGSLLETCVPFAKKAWRVQDPAMLPDILSSAFGMAVMSPPGPVLVDFPVDMLSRPLEGPVLDAAAGHARGRPSGDPVEVERALDILWRAERPVIHAGGGVNLADAHHQLRQFIEVTGIPAVTTIMGKGVIPEDHPLCFGPTGLFGSPVANRLTREADVILAIGSRFSEVDSSSWIPGQTFTIPPTKLIQIDIDPREIGKIYPVALGIQGDAGAVLQQLLDGVADRQRTQRTQRTRPTDRVVHIQQYRRAYQEWFTSEIGRHQQSKARPIRPERILWELRRVLPRDGILLTDTGGIKFGVAQQFPFFEPRTQLTAGGCATVGFGLAAAIGAKVGAPAKPVVAIVQDRAVAFGLVGPAVATAVECGLGVIWLIMHDDSLDGTQENHISQTSGTESLGGGSRETYNRDLAKVGETYGAHGRRIEDPEELAPALAEAIRRDEPTVLNVFFDQRVRVPASWEP